MPKRQKKNILLKYRGKPIANPLALKIARDIVKLAADPERRCSARTFNDFPVSATCALQKWVLQAFEKFHRIYASIPLESIEPRQSLTVTQRYTSYFDLGFNSRGYRYEGDYARIVVREDTTFTRSGTGKTISTEYNITIEDVAFGRR